MVKKVIDISRETIEEGVELPPLVYLGNSHIGQIDIIANLASLSKNECAALFKRHAKAISADMFLMVSEAWMLPPARVAEQEAIMKQHGSIGNSPYRIDAVCFNLQTRAGTWIGSGNIMLANGARTFKEVEFISCNNATGRFTNILV